MATVPSITLLPQAPTRTDPTTFDAKADAFLAALNTFDDEMNATITAINTLDYGNATLDQFVRTSLVANVRNTSGSTINAGVAVKITGFDSGTGYPLIAPITAATDTFAGVTQAAINNNANGYLLVRGVVGTTLNTSAVTLGTPVFINPANGALQLTASAMQMGVTCSQEVSGKVYVQVGHNQVSTLLYGGSAKLAATSTGATVTGTLVADGISVGDNAVIQLGTGNDLQLAHDGTNSYITNLTGTLFLRPKSGETGLALAPDGAVTLYHDNAAKLATSATGATVTGTLVADGLSVGDSEIVSIGSATDLHILHDGTNSLLFNYTGDLYLQQRNNTLPIRLSYYNGSSDENMLRAVPNGAVELYHDNAKKFETTATGATVTGLISCASTPTGINDLTNKAYVDGLIASNDAMVFKGVIDCSTNPNYPAANRGETYKVSVAGKIGGASGPNVEAGDLLMCITDTTASGDHATVGAQWVIAQTNLDGAVIGPTSATSGRIATFNGATGKLIQDGGILASNIVRKDANSTIEDNIFLYIGSGVDMYLVHDGSTSWIGNNTGGFNIRQANANWLVLSHYNGSIDEPMVIAKPNGAVELYYDNAKRLETSNDGIVITGVGTGGEGGQLALTRGTGYSGSWVMDALGDQLRFFDSASGIGNLMLDKQGATNLLHNGSTKLSTTASGVNVTGELTVDGAPISGGPNPMISMFWAG